MSAPLEGPPGVSKRKTPVGLIVAVGIGATCLFGIPILAALLFPVFAQARRAAQSTRCMLNLRQLGTSISLYAADSDGTLPKADRWMDDLAKVGVRKRFLRCPSIPAIGGSQFGYAFNEALSAKKLVSLKGNPPVIFDSNLLGKNAASSLDTVPSPGRHSRGKDQGNHILHMDGSVETQIRP